MNIEIIDTTSAHIRLMASCMRYDGLDPAPHKSLWRVFRGSMLCKTAFINGKIAAIWGVIGELFSEIGKPWLIMSSEVEAHPMKIAFAYRREIGEMQKMFPVLEDYIDESDSKTARLLELMGFKISKNKVAFGNTNLHRAVRRAS